jgi:NAD-dependent dihydropyrimidine dehydrogenase PreA subunit/coenzyme F420-reducing hydrogenase delta subunit
MANVATLMGLIDQLESPKLTVKQNKCVLCRNKNGKCLRCVDACTSGCIALDALTGQVRITPENCIGCGACATACPTGAILPISPTDEELLASAAQAAETAGSMAIFACDQALAPAQNMYDHTKVVSVPCLGRVDEGAILTLVAAGAAENVRLVHADCQSCQYTCGIETAHTVVAGVQLLLDTWGSTAQVKITNKLPRAAAIDAPVEFDQSKRDFLRQTKTEATSIGTNIARATVAEKLGLETAQAPKLEHVDTATGMLPQAVPARRARINAALKALGEPADEMIDTRLWGHVIIDTQKCNGCRMCAMFCPTGALSKVEEETHGTFGVTHSPSACVKCRLCENICPAKCIELSELVFAVDMIRGAVETYSMPRPRINLNGRDTMLASMRAITGAKYISE